MSSIASAHPIYELPTATHQIERTVSRRDLVIGTVLAAAMMAFFSYMSSGLSLIVTFVPGVFVAWLAFVTIHLRRIALPTPDSFLPLFFVALAIQFLHFTEEFNTGFATLFPELYGGSPYGAGLFVAFNMASYAVFTLAALLVCYRGIGFLLVPVLFYVVYGTIGNAITHTWWVAWTQSYFPGFWTALLYWIAGPWLLYRLLRDRNLTVGFIVGLAVLLVATVTLFMSR